MRNHSGYTLLELVCTIILISILLTIAIPHFQSLKNQHLLDIQTAQLQNDIQFARNSAISLHTNINLCPSDDDQTCVTNSNNGWILFISSIKNNEPIMTILRQYQLKNESHIQWLGMGNDPKLVFNQLGNAQGHNGRFIVQIKNNAQLQRTLIISPTGRMRLA